MVAVCVRMPSVVRAVAMDFQPIGGSGTSGARFCSVLRRRESRRRRPGMESRPASRRRAIVSRMVRLLLLGNREDFGGATVAVEHELWESAA